jgi:hypothetical protein
MKDHNAKEITGILKSSSSPVVLFGAGSLGKLVLHALKILGIKIHLLGLKLFSPSILTYKPKEKLSNVFVIICQRHKSFSEKISSQVEGIGLKKEQIAQQIF